MVKYGADTLIVYKEVKKVLRQVESEVMREIRKRAANGSPYEVVHYSYKLEALSMIKNAISDNKEWNFSYDSMYKLTKKSVVEQCVNTIASKMKILRGFKLGNNHIYGSGINNAFGACMRTVFDAEVNKEPKLVSIKDTGLVVSHSRQCSAKTNNKRVQRELGYELITVKIREENIYDARESVSGVLYAIDTPENREIIAQYGYEVLNDGVCN